MSSELKRFATRECKSCERRAFIHCQQVRFVTVDSTVKLEVLDWGGSGRSVLWVGCYLTAHVYDNIAPKLTDQFHVYAITRRGVGASDHPSSGCSPQRRADDVLEVIDALKLERADSGRQLVRWGHSAYARRAQS
jgi:pimeloyl-ACP methyl ester carboxylesterase